MPTPPNAAEYNHRVVAEQRFFNETMNVHDLPPIYHYWSQKWILPKLRAFGIQGATELFENHLADHCKRPGARHLRFASLGAGNCDLEVDLANRLRKRGYSDFLIECVDLNPVMLARGRDRAELAGMAAHLVFVEGDLNQWQPEHAYNVVFASHILHHVLNLEVLFERVRAALLPGGQFVVSDMIGRNGHMRWPEALEIVQQFWAELPQSYRYNRPLKRQEEFYDNWDCSIEGFEGIRAQDILPSLLKTFHFEFFTAFANVISPFVDRAFGYNFDAGGTWDREFIDRVHLRDEQEMLEGRIKPTIMMATLGTDPTVPTQYIAPFHPAYCVRWPDGDQEYRAPANAWSEIRELREKMSARESNLQSELSCVRASLETAQWQINQAANSRWVRLGRRLGLGPNLR